ncbi:Outer membrane protein beta-barrel domain-containing protein [Ruegeria halocynthiae]|uniref:Outer membrane protein beta-barrel domain-containing protein n=1 Tax=Ruegeria halocynthiae TaxID=985054 RepID=A0A1H2T275_9RHOB|nr:outer membrane beta-barrel protein [Ruegeria halocynthiae]SDW37958.1 Outer membrane protein beta-barrel domain-containing protein [Ruegeria halocynthiae]
MKSITTVLVAALVTSAGSVVAEDWTGPYAGFSFGYADTDGSGGVGGSSASFGPLIGYDHDFGSFVLGGELEYNRLNLDLGQSEGSLDSLSRLKLRGGYDFGSALGYIVLGTARASTSGDSDTAAVYGIGVAYPIGDRFVISGEALRQDFDNVPQSGGSLDTSVFNLRTTFRF